MEAVRLSRQWVRLATPKRFFWIRLIRRGFEVFSGGAADRRGKIVASLFATDEEAESCAEASLRQAQADGFHAGAAPGRRAPSNDAVRAARRRAWYAFDPLVQGGDKVEAAVLRHNAVALARLFAKGVRPDVRVLDDDPDHDPTEELHSEPAFVTALYIGTPELVNVFLDAGLDVRSLDHGSGMPSLCAACGNDEHRAVLVELLLARSADPNAADREGKRPLHHALHWPRASRVIPMLLASGADPSASDAAGQTPLHMAVLSGFGHLTAARLLLAAGADTELKDARGFTALDYCRECVLGANVDGKWGEIASLLEASGPKPSVDAPLGELHRLLEALRASYEDRRVARRMCNAARAGDLELVRLFLDDGQEPNEWCRPGFYPIEQAKLAGAADVVELLRAHGATERGGTIGPPETPRARPARQDASARAEMDARAADLVGAVPDLERVRVGTEALFRIAAKHGLARVVDAVVSRGVDPNGVAEEEWTPLTLAAREGHREIVAALLAAGADPNLSRDDRRSPLSDAAGGSDPAIVELLLERGADPTWVGVVGQTALSEATGPHRNAVRQAIRRGLHQVLATQRAPAALKMRRARAQPRHPLDQPSLPALGLRLAIDAAGAAVLRAAPGADLRRDVARATVPATERFAFLLQLRDRDDSWLLCGAYLSHARVVQVASAIQREAGVSLVAIDWDDRPDSPGWQEIEPRACDVGAGVTVHGRREAESLLASHDLHPPSAYAAGGFDPRGWSARSHAMASTDFWSTLFLDGIRRDRVVRLDWLDLEALLSGTQVRIKR